MKGKIKIQEGKMTEHEFSGKIFEITDCDITIDGLKEKPFFPQEYSEEILSSNIILLPVDNYNKVDYPVFPEKTSAFYEYLKENEPNGVSSSICIADDRYAELELHNDEITLATILVFHVALPMAVSLVSNYLYDIMKKRRKKLDVKIDIIVTKNKKSKKIKYQGAVEDFEKTLKSLPDNFLDV